MANTKTRRRQPRGGGAIRRLPSGRYQVRIVVGHDEHGTPILKPGPETYLTKQEALDHLNGEEPAATPSGDTFARYAELWLSSRTLKPRTVDLYQSILDDTLVPAFGSDRLSRITPDRVRKWYSAQDPAKPTRRRHAYGLLSTIMRAAVRDRKIASSPCTVEGGFKAVRTTMTTPATLKELDTIVEAMPDRYRGMVLLAAWCALRFGELTELRRDDIDLEAGVIHVRRGVVHTTQGALVGDPKSSAGKRTVAIPPHIIEPLRHHLDAHVGPRKDALLFPAASGEHLRPSTFYGAYYPARDKAKRPDLRFHDLRHTGAYLAAGTGASLVDMMARLGHSTPRAAMVYQHASGERDRAIAEGLSSIARGDVVDIKSRRRTASGK